MREKKNMLLFLTVVWIFVIWTHSAMPGDISSNESGFALEMIKGVLSVFGMGEWVTEHFVRKLAHFTEYLILGILITTDMKYFYNDFKKHIFIPLYVGIMVPVVDETIQIFSEDRGSSLIDVWIDYCGVISGILVVIAIVYIKLYKNKKATK